jgi:hypothetical protein
LYWLQVNVSNLEQSSQHYEKLLGRATIPARFDPLELLEGPPGFHRFTVSARAFNPAQATRRLEALGSRMEKPQRRGMAVQFLDLDGFRVEVANTQLLL